MIDRLTTTSTDIRRSWNLTVAGARVELYPAPMATCLGILGNTSDLIYPNTPPQIVAANWHLTTINDVWYW